MVRTSILWLLGIGVFPMLSHAEPEVVHNENEATPVAVSTGSLLTPISPYTVKPPYEQAQQELLDALTLFNQGKMEEASDKALEAYDDFRSLPRRIPGVKKAKMKAQTHQAASVYIEGGIGFILQDLNKKGRNAKTVHEARVRMDDLNDVARNYSDLSKMLKKAIYDLHDAPEE